MPPNSKNNKLSFKESSISTNDVEPLESQETIEHKSKKMSKIVPTEETPQKGGGKVKITKEKDSEVETKVEASEPPKLKGKSKASVVKVEEPVKVEEAPVKVEEAPVKIKSKSKGKSKDEVEEVKDEDVQKTDGVKSKTTKPTKANKNDENLTKETKSENETTVEGETDVEKYVRSFKVLLPGNQEFIGRYTGLTPYQAANKALSKFFRENKTIKTTNNEITFSIRESTRGSKRSTYTYNGTREKLENPVKYSINGLDGNAREIVKEYKNKLTKVKKSESDVIVNETST
jgi:hypothetical protein